MEDMDEAEFLLISDDEADDSFVLGDSRMPPEVYRPKPRQLNALPEEIDNVALLCQHGFSACSGAPEHRRCVGPWRPKRLPAMAARPAKSGGAGATDPSDDAATAHTPLFLDLLAHRLVDGLTADFDVGN